MKKRKIVIWFIVVCTHIDNEYKSLLFQTFFSYCFCMLSELARVFERKVWRVKIAYLRNAARALSSPSRCFQLSTNLGKDFFRYLWYCNKKQIECGLAWHWWDQLTYFNQSECRNCCLNTVIQKIAPQAKSGKYIQIRFFPRFGGKKWQRSEHSHASYPGLSGRKESSGTGLYKNMHGTMPQGLLKRFQVLKKCRNKFDCLVYEMIFIRALKPNLNVQ